jgi:uncharacterized phage infection (PIP) family protein YhgE
MQKMSAPQCLTISHWYAVVARTLSNASTLPSLSQQNVDALTKASDDVAIQSSNLATKAVQVEFADAGKAFRDVSDAASQASEAANKLANDVTKINNLLEIAAKLIALSAAVLTGNYGNALTDLVALVGKPSPGQGAQDPLGS